MNKNTLKKCISYILLGTISLSLSCFAIKPLKFHEGDKTLEELSKQINTSPIYQIELYELDIDANITPENPNICNYISENSGKARIIFGANGISFRVKERNWVAINKK